MAIEKLFVPTFIELSKIYPVLDVRSPGEFSHAHIPGAYSLPLFTDEEQGFDQRPVRGRQGLDKQRQDVSVGGRNLHPGDGFQTELRRQAAGLQGAANLVMIRHGNDGQLHVGGLFEEGPHRGG